MKILLVPGSGAGANVWHYQQQGLPDCEGVALPGHPDGQALESIPAYVEWLHGYIRQKGQGQVILGGHSLGGGIALMYALSYPQDLRGLVLIGTGARLRVRPDILESVRGMIGDPEAWRRYIGPPEAGSTKPQTPNTSPPEAGSAKPQTPNTNSPLPHPDAVLQEIRDMRLRIGPAVLLSDFLCCDRFDVMTRLGEIKLPTLIMVGTEDVMTPPKYAQFLADRIAGAKLVIVPGATHSIATEKPEEVNGEIGRWGVGVINRWRVTTSEGGAP